MEKKIILTGGGSAGHVTPNLALLPQLLAEGIEVHYIGTADGIERTILSERKDVTYHIISSGNPKSTGRLKANLWIFPNGKCSYAFLLSPCNIRHHTFAAKQPHLWISFAYFPVSFSSSVKIKNVV